MTMSQRNVHLLPKRTKDDRPDQFFLVLVAYIHELRKATIQVMGMAQRIHCLRRQQESQMPLALAEQKKQ